MAYQIRFLDDVALADMAFVVDADSEEELLLAATNALIESLADPATIGETWNHMVDQQADDLSSLLFDWLEEMVYLKDAHGVVFHKAVLHLAKPPEDRSFRVRGTLSGEQVDPSRQELRSDVKGVTKHLYAVTQERSSLRARVVLDV
jgi:SHS2 domain-containing protein